MIINLIAALLALTITSTPSPEASGLLDLWRAHRMLKVAPACVRNGDVIAAVDRLRDQYPEALEVTEVGRSFEDRPIFLLSLGHGERTIMLWSQMHGDEPSATPALFDLADYLLSAEDETSRMILREFRLLMVPMLNPDGAERATRRSAQRIDINRDALQRATPEARLLERLRREHEPFLGFNLHDQDRRKLVGKTRVIATQSVLAVAGDEAQTLTEGRKRAMRVCSVLVDTFHQLIPGGVGRFDEDWNARAFGDNLTAWGTPIVLIESGGLPQGENFSYLSGLTFVGLVRALEELGRNDAEDFSIEPYRQLPRNRNDGLVDVALHGADLVASDGKSLRLSHGDLAFDVLYNERELACASPDESESVDDLRARGVGHRGSAIQEIGDARFLVALDTQELAGSLIVPSLRLGVNGWKARRWLSAATMDDWASVGVGEVVWRVRESRRESALDFARDLGGVDRPRLRVVALRSGDGSGTATDSDRSPALIAQGSPKAPRDQTLRSIVAAIVGSEPGSPSLDEPLEGALLETRHPQGSSQASFLVLAPVPDQTSGAERSGEVLRASDLGVREVSAIWLRGREVVRSGRRVQVFQGTARSSGVGSP